jgi:hypothetical protein
MPTADHKGRPGIRVVVSFPWIERISPSVKLNSLSLMRPIAHAASSYQGGTAFFPSSLHKRWLTAISFTFSNISNATVDRHVVFSECLPTSSHPPSFSNSISISISLHFLFIYTQHNIHLSIHPTNVSWQIPLRPAPQFLFLWELSDDSQSLSHSFVSSFNENGSYRIFSNWGPKCQKPCSSSLCLMNRSGPTFRIASCLFAFGRNIATITTG